MKSIKLNLILILSIFLFAGKSGADTQAVRIYQDTSYLRMLVGEPINQSNIRSMSNWLPELPSDVEVLYSAGANSEDGFSIFPARRISTGDEFYLLAIEKTPYVVTLLGLMPVYDADSPYLVLFNVNNPDEAIELVLTLRIIDPEYPAIV